MNDFEKVRRLFIDAGLAFPTIPNELAVKLKEQGKWVFSTRELKTSPYNLEHYVQEHNGVRVEDYAILCHSGHGANSYAIQYYLVYVSLRMFLHLAWGGMYMDKDAAAAKIQQCISLADQIVPAVMTTKTLRSNEQLTIQASDFYGSYWSTLGQTNRNEKRGCRSPREALTEVLNWLGIRWPDYGPD